MAYHRPTSPVTVIGASDLNSASHQIATPLQNSPESYPSATIRLDNDDSRKPIISAVGAALAHNVDLTFLGTERTATDFLRDTVIDRSTLASPAILSIDLASISQQLSRFRSMLPGVRIHYALKCLPDPIVISMLARLGASFDCASGTELNIVHKELSSIGHGDEHYVKQHVVFANPVKSVVDLQLAKKLGVTLVTADSMEEVHKLSCHLPNAQVIVRICTNDATAQVPLSAKFGARPEEIGGILQTAVELGITVVGVAFHVGSGARHVQPYRQALQTARDVFDIAQDFGISLNVIDIGGGFPGTDCDAGTRFDEIVHVVRASLDELFPSHVNVLAEPGRFLVKACGTLATRVLRTSWYHGIREYTIGDGVYGSFRDAHVFGERYPASLLWSASPLDENDPSVDYGEAPCRLVGLSLREEDVIEPNTSLPPVTTGDWLVFRNMGAYSYSLRTLRTDIPSPSLRYVYSMPT